MDPLLRWRAEFPIVEKTTYMITHSLGAMPRRAEDRLREFAAMWSTRGIRALEEQQHTKVAASIGVVRFERHQRSKFRCSQLWLVLL